jgi:hypothetical protein
MTIEEAMKANLLSKCDWDVDLCHENLLRLQLQLVEAGGRPLTEQNLRLQFIKNVNIKTMKALLATLKDIPAIIQHVKLMQAMDEVPAKGSGEVGPATASQVFFADKDRRNDRQETGGRPAHHDPGRPSYHDPGHHRKAQRRDKAVAHCDKCNKTHITGDHWCTARCGGCGKPGHCKAQCHKAKKEKAFRKMQTKKEKAIKSALYADFQENGPILKDTSGGLESRMAQTLVNERFQAEKRQQQTATAAFLAQRERSNFNKPKRLQLTDESASQSEGVKFDKSVFMTKFPVNAENFDNYYDFHHGL